MEWIKSVAQPQDGGCDQCGRALYPGTVYSVVGEDHDVCPGCYAEAAYAAGPGQHNLANELVAFCEWAEAQGHLKLVPGPHTPSSLMAEYLRFPEGSA